MNPSISFACVAAMSLLLATTNAGAQSLVSQASSAQLIFALGGDAEGGLPSKAFRRTAAPDAVTHACPEVMADSNTGLGQKNLTVVYAADTAGVAPPTVNLAIQFVTGADKIQTPSEPLLSNLAAALNTPSMTNVRVAVAGHTDATGTRDTNLRLSCARAISVRNRLIQLGVGADRLGAYGFGSDKPLQAGVVESAINRRVEIRRAN